MVEQPSIFDTSFPVTDHTLEQAAADGVKVPTTLPPFQRHSETSRQAALSVYGAPSQSQESRVYSLLLESFPRGWSDEQIAEALDLNPSAERPRRVKLVEKGLIEAHGEGTTRAGRRCTLWRAKP